MVTDVYFLTMHDSYLIDTGLLTPQQAPTQIAGTLAAHCASVPCHG